MSEYVTVVEVWKGDKLLERSAELDVPYYRMLFETDTYKKLKQKYKSCMCDVDLVPVRLKKEIGK